MGSSSGVHKIRQFEIIILVLFLSIFLFRYDCLAKKEKLSKYRIKVELLTPQIITNKDQVYKVIILDVSNRIIECYHHNDPTREIRLYHKKKWKIKEVESIIIEGYFIDDNNDDLSILVKKYLKENKASTHNILQENNHWGVLLHIPISEIKKISIWEKSWSGRGALAGAGAGILFSGMVASQHNPEDNKGMVVFSKADVFCYSAVITVPVGILIGAAAGFSEKDVKNIQINGIKVEYYKNRKSLRHYKAIY